MEKIGKHIKLINGFPFTPKDWGIEGKKIIRIQNLNSEESNYNYAKKNVDEKYIVRKGDLLISWSGSLGIYEWEQEDALLNQHIFKVEFITGDISKSYFKYLFHQVLLRLSGKTRGLGLKHLKKGQIENFELSLPNKEEQNKIVSILDQASLLIKKRKRTLDLLNEFQNSLFLEMFGDPVINEKRWPIAKKGEIDFLNGYAFKSELFKSKSANSIPVIKINSIKNNHLDDTKFRYLNRNLISKHKNYLVKNGDLIMSLTGTYGKDDYGNICFLKSEKYSEYFLNQRVAKLQYDEASFDSNFIYYLFKNPNFKKYLLSTSKGARQGNLSSEKLKSLKYFKPNKEIQKKFHLLIEQTETQMQRLYKSGILLEELLQTLIYKNIDSNKQAVDEINNLMEDEIKLELFLNTMNSSDFQNEETYSMESEKLFKILERTAFENENDPSYKKGIVQKLHDSKIILESNREYKNRIVDEATAS